MMRNMICACLILVLFLPMPAAMAQMGPLNPEFLPEDTIAVVFSPESSEHYRIIYAVHGITKDKETFSVSVRQMATDSQWKIYDADTDGISEPEIRWLYGFPDELPILGSYCEAYLANGQDAWIYCRQDSSIPYGNQLDEQFTFGLSEITGEDQKTIMQLVYGSIATPGAIYASPLCQMTIDLSAYLNSID